MDCSVGAGNGKVAAAREEQWRRFETEGAVGGRVNRGFTSGRPVRKRALTGTPAPADEDIDEHKRSHDAPRTSSCGLQAFLDAWSGPTEPANGMEGAQRSWREVELARGEPARQGWCGG